MTVLFILLSSGLSSEIEIGDSCVAALHSLRTKQMMQIESTEAVDGTLIYTLKENRPEHYHLGSKDRTKKTAILGCSKEPEPV